MLQYSVLVIVSQAKFPGISASKLKDFYAIWKIIPDTNIRYRKFLNNDWT